MILEALTYLLTPCPKPIKKMGYLGELIAIRARHNRCKRHWKNHLEKSKQTIRDAIGECRQKRRALVIGSGIWLDVPVADLSKAFDEVVLVDIVHLLPERIKAKLFSNVRLVQLDVTGTAEKVYETGKPVMDGAPPDLGDDFDLVVSCNILSQLPIMPREYLSREEKVGQKFTDAELDKFSEKLIKDHLDWLRAFSGTTLLITDYQMQVMEGDRLVDEAATLYGETLPDKGRTWDWDVAPQYEQHSVQAVRLNVRAGLI